MTNESAFLKQVSSTRGGSNRYGGGAGGQQRRRNSAPRPGGAQRPGFKRNAPQPFNTGGPRPKRASDDAKRGKVFTRDGYISNDFTEEKKPTEMKMRSRRKKNTDSPED